MSEEICIDLKNCPFCQGTNLSVMKTTERTCQIRCKSCRACGPHTKNETVFQAWNHRPKKAHIVNNRIVLPWEEKA